MNRIDTLFRKKLAVPAEGPGKDDLREMERLLNSGKGKAWKGCFFPLIIGGFLLAIAGYFYIHQAPDPAVTEMVMQEMGEKTDSDAANTNRPAQADQAGHAKTLADVARPNEQRSPEGERKNNMTPNDEEGRQNNNTQTNSNSGENEKSTTRFNQRNSPSAGKERSGVKNGSQTGNEKFRSETNSGDSPQREVFDIQQEGGKETEPMLTKEAVTEVMPFDQSMADSSLNVTSITDSVQSLPPDSIGIALMPVLPDTLAPEKISDRNNARNWYGILGISPGLLQVKQVVEIGNGDLSLMNTRPMLSFDLSAYKPIGKFSLGCGLGFGKFEQKKSADSLLTYRKYIHESIAGYTNEVFEDTLTYAKANDYKALIYFRTLDIFLHASYTLFEGDKLSIAPRIACGIAQVKQRMEEMTFNEYTYSFESPELIEYLNVERFYRSTTDRTSWVVYPSFSLEAQWRLGRSGYLITEPTIRMMHVPLDERLPMQRYVMPSLRLAYVIYLSHAYPSSLKEYSR